MAVATTLTIGRLGVWVVLEDPEVHDAAGRLEEKTVTLRGKLNGADLSETKGFRDELIAMAEYGKPVPVTWDGDDTLNGWYVVLGSRVRTRSLVDTGVAEFDVTLRLIGSAGETQLESAFVGGIATNVHGIVETTAGLTFVHAVPSLLNGTREQLHYYVFSDGQNRISGSATRFPHAPGDETDNVSITAPAANSGNKYPWFEGGGSRVRWSVDLDAYYAGAAWVEVGGEVRTGIKIPNEPTNWRLSNGLIDLQPILASDSTVSAENVTRLQTRLYNDNTHESTRVFRFVYDETTGPATFEVRAWKGIKVLRNDPEQVSIRLTGPGRNAGRSSFLDLTVKRGEPFVRGRWVLNDEFATETRIVPVTASTVSSLTGGLYEAQDDADGNRHVMASPTTHSVLTTAGGIEWDVSAETTPDKQFMIGYEIDGDPGSLTNNEAQQIIYQFHVLADEEVRVISR